MAFRWQGTVRQDGDLVEIIKCDDQAICERETNEAAARRADLGHCEARVVERRPAQGSLF